MPAVVGQPVYVTWDGVTAGQTWTVTAAERNTTDITGSLGLTVTDLGDGRYRGVFTTDADGVHALRIESNLGLWETPTIDVLTEAQADPAGAVASGFDVGTLGYEIHATFKRPAASGGD